MSRCRECTGRGKQAWWRKAEGHGDLVCGDHKTEGMIYTKKKPTCENPSCTKTYPAYGEPGRKRRYCGEHAESGMIDLAHKRCAAQGCKKQASKGEYCGGCFQPQQKPPADTLTGALAARSHHEREGWWHPSESPAQPSAATAVPRVTTPSASGVGGEPPRKPAPPSAATTDDEGGRQTPHRAPPYRPRTLVNNALKLFTAHKQTAPASSAETPPHRSACATTKATLEPVAASPAVAAGEAGREERVDTTPAPAPPLECDGGGDGVGGEEVREVVAQLVDVTEATGAGQGAAASPASVEMVTIGGLDVLAAVAVAAEAEDEREAAAAALPPVPASAAAPAATRRTSSMQVGAAPLDGEGSDDGDQMVGCSGLAAPPAAAPEPDVRQAPAAAPVTRQGDDGSSSSSGGEGAGCLAPDSFSYTGAAASGGGHAGGRVSGAGHAHQMSAAPLDVEGSDDGVLMAGCLATATAEAAGEVGREERAPASAAAPAQPEPPSECDGGGEEAHLVDRVRRLTTAAKGAGQGVAAEPAIAEMVHLEAATEAAEDVQGEGEGGAAEAATATGEEWRGERALMIDTYPAPSAMPPAPDVPQASAAAPAEPAPPSECDGGVEVEHMVLRFTGLTTAAAVAGQGAGGGEGAGLLPPGNCSGTGAVASGGGRGRGGVDASPILRRSSRVPGSSALESQSVVDLLDKIRADDPEVEVLKIHHCVSADVSAPVIDALLDALMLNSNCQALYIQNASLRDEQLRKLAEVLHGGNIWCLNAGENSGISISAWWWFVEEIKNTNVTHAYLGECIPGGLKGAMRDAIRANRTKHTRHRSASNVDVIRQCTHMWWNPMLGSKLQEELKGDVRISSSGSSSGDEGGGSGRESEEGGGVPKRSSRVDVEAAKQASSSGGSEGGSSTVVNGKGKRKASKQPSRAGRPKKKTKKKRDPENREERWALVKDDDEREALECEFYARDVEAREKMAIKERAAKEADMEATEALEEALQKKAARKRTNAMFFGPESERKKILDEEAVEKAREEEMERFLNAGRLAQGWQDNIQTCGDATCGICKKTKSTAAADAETVTGDARDGGVSGGARGQEHEQDKAAVLAARQRELMSTCTPLFKRVAHLLPGKKGHDKRFREAYARGLIFNVLTTPGAKPVSQKEFSRLTQSAELRTARTERAFAQQSVGLRTAREERILAQKEVAIKCAARAQKGSKNKRRRRGGER